jgi:hypothetical protein
MRAASPTLPARSPPSPAHPPPPPPPPPLKHYQTLPNITETPVWNDDIVQRAFGGLAPFTTPVERVQLAVKSLESNLQFITVMSRLDQAVKLTK